MMRGIHMIVQKSPKSKQWHIYLSKSFVKMANIEVGDDIEIGLNAAREFVVHVTKKVKA